MDDDPGPMAVARSLGTSEHLWAYACSNPRRFVQVLSLKNVYTEDRPLVDSGLALMTHGVEFGDALHLVSQPQGTDFLTFDQTFVRKTKLRRPGDRPYLSR
jgi:hypothetical protein